MLVEPNVLAIRQTALQLGIPDSFVRKDYFVTEVIRLLMQIKDIHYALAFQGGTSLSKGYQLVARMSEDVDFRVTLTAEGKALGKAARRRALRHFRHSIVTTLREAGFDLAEDAIRVLYEGRYMRLNVSFPEADQLTYLKPHVMVECFLGETQLPLQSCQINSLVKATLGDHYEEQTESVNCVALDETAAEKWVALTRRIANSQIKERPSDKHLVRHLYDLYHLNTSGLLTGEYKHLIADLLKKDAEQFQKYNSAYNDNPLKVSQEAVIFLGKKPIWREHWENFITQMVYGDNKPSFDNVYDNLSQMSDIIFSEVVLGKATQ